MHRFPYGVGRSAALVIGAALLGVSAVGCSSSEPKRAYAVPADLCGTKVPGSALTPLLPPGKKAVQEPSAAVGVQRCRLKVDGEVALSTSVEKRAADVSAQDVAQSAEGVEPTDTASGDGQYVYGKSGAVGRVACPSSSGKADSGKADRSIWVTARVSEAADDAKDLLGFVKAYAEATAGTDACTKL
ncbi:hypothetical protein GTW43_00305 [Streptomyces sp. SID5785]|uniref:hypothetical protein n=1 Tax=Streptomyces sp. SID5785 TaxID=2690309 RepID=UPI00136136F6|nr:hypothetical protein [Streptomyces sp. SID5785]MZD03530.1 hypothetical protein [Streptomyces sp. SID5785]